MDVKRWISNFLFPQKSQAIFKTKTDVMFTSQKVCISHLHSRLCENCSVPTKPVELQLCQINFREAMYLCTQPNVCVIGILSCLQCCI